MNDIQKAYMACAIDAEGTITFVVHPDKDRFHPMIAIGNTNREWLEYIKTVSGVGGVCNHAPGSNIRRPSYQWSISGLKTSLSLLRDVVDSLIIKRRQALLVIKHCENRLSKLSRDPNTKFTNEDFELVNEIRCLNKKGPITPLTSMTNTLSYQS